MFGFKKGEENSRRKKILAGSFGAVAIVLIAIAAFLFGPSLGGPGSMDFGAHQKVSAQSTLRMSFPKMMKTNSVEEHLKLPEGVTGKISWEGNTLVFDPEMPLEHGQSYVFLVDRKAEATDGTELGEDLTFTFVVTGAPKVANRLPLEDSKDVTPNTNITIVFDRPMVPLTQVQGEASKTPLADWPVTITPTIAGRWRWLGTTTVTFVPDKGLSPNTMYRVSVPAGIKTVAGDVTEADFSWNFETIRAGIVTTDPPSGYSFAGPTTQFVLTFNQTMDLKKMESHVRLAVRKDAPQEKADERKIKRQESASGATPPVTSDTLPFTLTYGQVEKNGVKVNDRTMVVVVPKTKLALSTNYELVLTAGLQGEKGDLGSETDYTLPFQTVGDLKVTNTRYEWGGVSITFSQPIDAKTVKRGITIKPKVAGWDDLTMGVNDWDNNREVSFYPELAPSTEYTITVTSALKDAFGQPLKEPYNYTFKTLPVPPKVFIHSNGEFGIFERGKAPVYYLNAVNVSTMDIGFAKLTLPQFLEMRQAQRQNYEYEPDLSGKTDYKTWSVPMKLKPDTWDVTEFNVEEKVGSSLGAGIYALTLTAPEYKQDWGNMRQITEYQYFALTDIALTLKHSGNRALVWAVNMKTGLPVPAASIKFHSLNGSVVKSGATDKDGFFETAIDINAFVTGGNDWRPEFFVTAEKDGDFAFVGSEWADGFRSGDFGFAEDIQWTNAPRYRVDSYVYTDRPVYRAGDTVNFKGVVRLRGWDGNFILPSSNLRAVVTVNDAEGKEVYRSQLPFSEFGGFEGKLTLGEETSLGDYYLQFNISPETDTGQIYQGTSFAVLAYRKPEYRVDLTTEKDNYFNGEKVVAGVEGAYYFGAPMDGAPVTWRANKTDYFFNKYTDGWYSFALEENWCWWSCERETEQIAEGTGTLDSTGHLRIELPIDLADEGVSQVITVEADITDPNNQVVSNRVSVPVHKAGIYVGVKSDDYVVTPGEEATFSFVSIDPDGKPLGNTPVELQLFARTWNSIRKKSVDGEYYYDNEAKDTFIRTVNARTGGDGKGTAAIKIENGGEFRVVATARDGSGREAKAGTSVYAWSSTYFNWPHSNSNRMDVIADKPEYQVGETAKLLVKSPFQGKGVRALITVERENVITRSVVDVTSNAQSFEIPITEDLIPNAYVSVLIIKPREGETFNEFGLDTGAPAFRIGYAKLKVETRKKKMNVTMNTDKERYGPGETVTVDLISTDDEGRPIKGEFSLAAVDMSVLALTGFEMPNLLDLFYSDRGLGVLTSESLMHLIERFKPGSKGGGGSDPEMKKRGNFKDTAYWNPKIVTNDDGRATVTFKLPDNLTTWHLLAIGSTKDHKFGSVAKEVIETKKVILRPVRPRFAVHGDEAKLGAIVHNFLPEARTFTVTLSGNGFEHLGTNPLEIRVGPDSMEKLIFPVRIVESDQATFTFKAETEGALDEIEEKIPLYPFGTPQAVATAGITESAVKETVHVPSTRDAVSSKLEVTAAPTIATYLPAGLNYLVRFPYGCTEQTVSSFLPNVAVAALEGLDAFEIADDATLKTNISAGLQRLYQFQRFDGGFGYWQESQESYAYLTAYVLFALQKTKDAGYTVDQPVLDRTRGYLDQVLRSQKLDSKIDLATRTYILFVLSETGGVDRNLLKNVYDKRKELPLFGKAQLAMAFQGTERGAAVREADTLMKDIVNFAKVDTRGTHFEEGNASAYDMLMHTDTRTTAFVLQAMMRIDPKNTLAPNIVRYLLAVRERGHWDTTQSTVQSIFAFIEYLNQTKELDANFTAGIEVNGKMQKTEKFSRENILTRIETELASNQLKAGSDNDVVIGKEGPGRLYYDILLSYFYKAEKLDAIEQGIGILREMEPMEKGMKGVPVGSTHRVTLTITVPENRHFVAVESPLPAGMEPIDLRLSTTQQDLLKGTVNDVPRDWSYWEYGLRYFNHVEFRDDQIFLFADNLPAGVYEYQYLVRATTPGKFKLRPARAWEMYFPETFGQTSGEWFTVSE